MNLSLSIMQQNICYPASNLENVIRKGFHGLSLTSFFMIVCFLPQRNLLWFPLHLEILPMVFKSFTIIMGDEMCSRPLMLYSNHALGFGDRSFRGCQASMRLLR